MHKPTSPRRAAHLAARQANKHANVVLRTEADITALLDAIARQSRATARNITQAAQHYAAARTSPFFGND